MVFSRFLSRVISLLGSRDDELVAIASGPEVTIARFAFAPDRETEAREAALRCAAAAREAGALRCDVIACTDPATQLALLHVAGDAGAQLEALSSWEPLGRLALGGAVEVVRHRAVYPTAPAAYQYGALGEAVAGDENAPVRNILVQFDVKPEHVEVCVCQSASTARAWREPRSRSPPAARALTFPIPPPRTQAFASMLVQECRAVRRLEPRNLRYDLLQECDAPSRFVVVEVTARAEAWGLGACL